VIVHSAAGRFVEAHRLLDANQSRTGDTDDDLAFSVDAGRAVALVLEGRVTEARRIASSVYTRSLAVNGRQSAFSNVAAVTLAIACYERNRTDEARLLLADRQQALRSASPLFMLWAALCESRLEQLQESPEAALVVLERQSSCFRARNLDRPLAFILSEQARIHARMGNRQGAGESAGELDSLCRRLGSNDGFYAEIPILMAMAQARRSLACGDPEAALKYLSGIGDVVARLGRGRMTVVVGSVTASALAAAGREREAVAELGRVVRLGSELGLMRTFLDEGDEMKASLARLLERKALAGAPRLYAQSLLDQFEPIRVRDLNDPPEEEFKAILRPREVEVMSLVAAGMTNKRIALTLGITPETVKWNLKNVFARIGVSNRYDALTWTRRHGLIDESGRQAVEIRA
jgi:LuxR family maltose regulon positive regulatory protein